jgi:hypothetical protein
LVDALTRSEGALSDSVDVETLFLARPFLRHQVVAQDKRLASFGWADGGTRASLTLAGRDGVWASPITGAFGGLAVCGRAGPAAVQAIVDQVGEWARAEPDVEVVRIRLAPAVFPDPLQPLLQNALFTYGWTLEQLDLNQHLAVRPAEGFAAGLNETRRKELRRLQRSGASFVTLDREHGQAAYDVIAENRAARGYPMTMSWPQVAALLEALPDRVGFHAVVRDGEVLAGAICLQVTASYPYVFYWGERPAHRAESPITLLAEGLVALAYRQNASTLDLGVSTDASILNTGLFAFKQSLGAEATVRPTFVLRR